MPVIATWNVNSVKARAGHLVDWLRGAAPDIALLQELKCTADQFPAAEIEALGYRTAVVGQKTYNGVAVLSRRPVEVLRADLPGDPEDAQARYLETRTCGLRVAALYLPNGNGDDAKYAYKLAWMDRLRARAKDLLATGEPFVLGGDYNVAPEDVDVFDPAAWTADALCRPETRAAYRALCHLGLTDAFRALHPSMVRYSWWDYRAGAWARDQGLRIDHLLLSPQAADRLREADVDRVPRGWEKPSDHTPVWCRLDD